MKLRVGNWDLEILKTPTGKEGLCSVKYKKETEQSWSPVCQVRYRVDVDGIWIDTQGLVAGFDLRAESNDQGGFEYQVLQRNQGDFWAGIKVRRWEELEAQAAQGTQGRKRGLKIKAQMPGKIIRLGVKVGDTVQKDQTLLVMEAMKMENEIKSANAGTVKSVHIVEGQAVETGALLVLIE